MIIPFPVWIILFPFFITRFRLVSKSEKHFVKEVFQLELRNSEKSFHFLFGYFHLLKPVFESFVQVRNILYKKFLDYIGLKYFFSRVVGCVWVGGWGVGCIENKANLGLNWSWRLGWSWADIMGFVYSLS